MNKRERELVEERKRIDSAMASRLSRELPRSVVEVAIGGRIWRRGIFGDFARTSRPPMTAEAARERLEEEEDVVLRTMMLFAYELLLQGDSEDAAAAYEVTSDSCIEAGHPKLAELCRLSMVGIRDRLKRAQRATKRKRGVKMKL